MLQYFRSHYGTRYPRDITWAHGANTTNELVRYLQDRDTMIIEVDVFHAPDGTPVMAHPPAQPGDETRIGTVIPIDKSGIGELTLESFLDLSSHTDKGIKLDFKSEKVVIPCLKLLKNYQIAQPVLLHADIIRAEQASEPHVTPEFLRLCKEYYPDGIISVGWKTNPDVPYSKQNIREMTTILTGYEDVLISVRACLAKEAWKDMETLTLGHPGRLLHLWNNEVVEPDLLMWIKNHTDPKSTLYDLIDANKNPLRFSQKKNLFKQFIRNKSIRKIETK